MRRAFVAVVLASLVLAPTVGAGHEEPAHNEGMRECEPTGPVAFPKCSLFSEANLTADCDATFCTITIEMFALATAETTGLLDLETHVTMDGVQATDSCAPEPIRGAVAPVLPSECSSSCTATRVGTEATCSSRLSGRVPVAPGEHVWADATAGMMYDYTLGFEVIKLFFSVHRLADGSVEVWVYPTGEE